MKRNFLNFKSDEIDKPIFRIMSYDWLIEMISSSKLTLARPKTWDDPYENFIMNSTGELQDGRMFSVSFRDNFYGQCWTQKRESDALWRIYSKEKDGVRITSTPKKLFKSLYESSNEFRDIHCFIGKVKYFATEKLKALLNENGYNWLTDKTGAGQAMTLLFKRTPFDYEKEVRLIYNSNGEIDGDYYTFDINPTELIDEIVFDPRMKYNLYHNRKGVLRNLGVETRIVKSNLYKTPSLKFCVPK